jgi:hypothetical protein
MAILILTTLMLVLGYGIDRARRWFVARTPSRNPEFPPTVGAARKPTVGHDWDSVAEAREVDLSRRLLNGRVDLAGYQRAMAELADADTRTGSVR